MLALVKKIFQRKKDGYFFIHIPKTAGTSFINVLDATTQQDNIFPCQLWQEVNEEIIAKKNNYQLLRGHFGGGAYKLLSSRNLHRLTILRHPQSLSISTFHFIKREKNTAVHELVTSKNMDLKAFLEEPLTAQKINNRMIRHLSFDLQKDPEAQALFLSAQSIKVVSKWIKTPKKIDNKKRLTRAQQALDECSWFGLQERFDESMQLFAYTFKRPPIGVSARLNTHKPSQEIDNHCRQLINKQNHYDLQLYSYAEKLFEQKYQAMLKHLKLLYDDHDCSTNELIDRYYHQHAFYQHQNSIDYDFSQPLLGAGWHRREITLPEQTHFRWTSTSQAYIDFWVTRQDYRLSVRFINAVSDQHLQDLQLYINDHTVDHEFDTSQGVVRILTAKINATMIKSMIKTHLIRIRFKHAKTLIHRDVFTGDDERSLGIAINWIKLNPCSPEN